MTGIVSRRPCGVDDRKVNGCGRCCFCAYSRSMSFVLFPFGCEFFASQLHGAKRQPSGWLCVFQYYVRREAYAVERVACCP